MDVRIKLMRCEMAIINLVKYNLYPDIISEPDNIASKGMLNNLEIMMEVILLNSKQPMKTSRRNIYLFNFKSVFFS